MIRIALYVIGLAVLVAGAVWLATDPGIATLEWRGWRIDTSVAVVVAAMIAAVVLIQILLRVLTIIGGTMKAIAAARRERRLNRGLTSLADGFAAVQAGQGKVAHRFAKEAATLLKSNPAVLMLRKEAATLTGDVDDMKNAATALLERPQTELAGLRALAAKAFADGDTVGAHAHTKRALARKDAPAWAVRMALELEVGRGAWREAIAVLNGKSALDAFPPAELSRIKTHLLIQQSQVDLNNGDSQAAAARAKAAMETGGDPIAATVAYGKAMTAQGKGRKAASAIERVWAQTPHADLAAAYRILVPGEPALEWAKRVDVLERLAPDHPESRLVVARASLDAQLWGQARNRLADLTAETQDPAIRYRAAQMLAEVESRERGDAQRAAHWLALALDAKRDRQARLPVPKTVADLLAS